VIAGMAIKSPGPSTREPLNETGMGLRVLLVEGDADNAECMTALLEMYGHRVELARNGLAALQLAQDEAPDVVLLELRLPGMDGWEVVRRLREQPGEKMPFCIALTSCSAEGSPSVARGRHRSSSGQAA
jgi:CheY-like chemotaxis protein